MDLKFVLIIFLIATVARLGQAQVSFKRTVREYADSNPQIIDVRTPQEFNAGHAKGAINIPLSEIKQNISLIERSRPVLIVCRSGNRSGQAVSLLKKMGFENLHNAGPWTNIP